MTRTGLPLFDLPRSSPQSTGSKPRSSIGRGSSVGLARRSDPATSHAAAEEHASTGRLESNRKRVLDLVVEYPRRTAVELFHLAGETIERHEVSRRLADLTKLGRVRKGPARVCRVNDRRMSTWEATEVPEQCLCEGDDS